MVTVGKRSILLAAAVCALLALSFVDGSAAMSARQTGAKAHCVVPAVKGRTLTVAKRRILKAHCRVGKIRRKTSTAVRKGHVLSQAPRAGRKLRRGTRVNLVVGSGPATPTSETLTVSLAGKGFGTVTSTPAGIICGSSCSSSFGYGVAVQLTATPTGNTGSSFAGWSGACTGTGTCNVVLNQASSVIATFSRQPPPPAPPTKVLATLPGKWQSFQTFAAPISATAPPPPPSPNALRFDFANATGVALPQPTGAAVRRGSSPEDSPQRLFAASSSSELESVDSNGQVSSAITSGSANVSQFLVAPNGKLYVLFTQPVDLDDTTLSGNCLLAEVDPASGVPTCVDDTLTSIAWSDQSTGVSPAVQLGSDGSVYYAGFAAGGNEVLRKYLDGATTDLINANITLGDFLALPDGSVLLSGTTNSTGATWLRRLSSTGSLQTLASGEDRFMRIFPDGNVYVGLWDSNYNGVKRFLTGTNQLETKYWISADINNQSNTEYYNANDFCPPASFQTRLAFCGWFGSFIRESFAMPDGKVFVVAGDPQQGMLMQYYPEVSIPTTSVQQVSLAQSTGHYLILSGVDSSSDNITTLYDPSTDEETPIFDSADQVEIYHLNYVPATNTMLFDGLRFSDNSYILGSVDLSGS